MSFHLSARTDRCARQPRTPLTSASDSGTRVHVRLIAERQRLQKFQLVVCPVPLTSQAGIRLGSYFRRPLVPMRHRHHQGKSNPSYPATCSPRVAKRVHEGARSSSAARGSSELINAANQCRQFDQALATKQTARQAAACSSDECRVLRRRWKIRLDRDDGPIYPDATQGPKVKPRRTLEVLASWYVGCFRG